MNYQEVLAAARGEMGPYCKVCPVCNGLACKNQIPGPGAKGIGTGFIRNYQKWQEICVNRIPFAKTNLLTPSLNCLEKLMIIPFFAAPIGAMQLHYG